MSFPFVISAVTLIASVRLTDSLRLSRSPVRKRSNASPIARSAVSSRALMRVICALALSATSLAHCSQ